jgi:cobalt-precorrin-6B (C15)-methyltransferase
MVPGIPDEFFIRGQVPMTKEEIRTVTLAKGKLFPEAIVYDLGSGTGSIAIEAALLAPKGRVYAYERKPEAVSLIEQNRDRFGVTNLEILCKEAPLGLEELPKANTVFIGGSGGRLQEILTKSLAQLQPKGRVVINAITLETLLTGLAFAREENLKVEAVTLSVSRLEEIGKSHWWKALNPISIITLMMEV